MENRDDPSVSILIVDKLFSNNQPHYRFSQDPQWEELLKFVRPGSLRSKRLRKKFLAHPGNYVGKWLPRGVLTAFAAAIGTSYIREQMNRPSFMRRVLLGE
jgi:hypothetical protein